MAAIQKPPLNTSQLVVRIALSSLLQGFAAFLTLIAFQYKIWIVVLFFGFLTIANTYNVHIVLKYWRTPR